MSQTTAKRLILIVFAMLLLPAVVMAATSWTDPNGYFRVELYGVDGTPGSGENVTYKYAVTDLAGTSTNALSHWTLGIQSCMDNIVKPLDGTFYTTPIEPAVCGTGGVYEPCTSATYLVEFGPDGQVDGVNGIKFLDPDPAEQLGNGETHLFFITVAGVTATTENPLVVKSGDNSIVGTIDGPSCEPTAVSFSNTSVASSGNTAFVAIAALTVLMGVVTVGAWRKHEK